MVTNSDAREGELPFLLTNGNQRQVGRAAAYVADQDHVAHFDLFAPGLVTGIDPGIEGRLRFLEQGKMLKPGGAGGLHG